MYREIGSFFEYRNLDADNFKGFGTSILDYLLFCVREKYISYYDSGRSALTQALGRVLRECRCKRCLVPSYTCSTVIQPFINAGFELNFYNVDKKLKISDANLEKLIQTIDPGVFLFHNYYGNNDIDPQNHYLYKYRERGGIIIEDYTQFLFGMTQERLNSVDYAVCSLRKWMPITDGGFLISSKPFDEKRVYFEEFVGLKKQAQRMKAEYLNGNEKAEKEQFLKLNLNAERLLDETCEIHGMSVAAYGRLSLTDMEYIKKKRRANALVLAAGLLGNDDVISAIDIDDNTVPLYYPVYTQNRESLQSLLRESDIYAPVLWPKDPIVSVNDVACDHIYNDLLCIPCDERYDKEDMTRIVSVLSTVE